jgi:membrane-associated phospholipid phosphatase
MGTPDGVGSAGARRRLGFDAAIVVSVLVYLSVSAFVYVRYGTTPEVSLGVIALMVLPVVGVITKSKSFVKNSALLIAVLLAYEALQGTAGAMVKSGSVVSMAGADHALLGTNFVLDVQNAFYSPATNAVAVFFYGMHVFLIMAALVLFWLKKRSVFHGYAYSLVLTSYLGLVTFVLMPTAPPYLAGTAQNLLSVGVKMYPGGFQTLQHILLAGESDAYAAFPSLHAAYATLFTIFMFRLGRKWGVASLPILGGVYFSIIYLGQHFLFDLIGGAAYSAAAVFVVDRLVARHAAAGQVPAVGPATPPSPMTVAGGPGGSRSAEAARPVEQLS